MEMQRLPANKEVQNIPLCMQNYSNGLLGCWRCPVGGLPSQGQDDQCGSLLQHAGQIETVPTGQQGSTFMSSFFMAMWNHPRRSNSGSISKDGKCGSMHYTVRTQHLWIAIFGSLRWSLAGQWFQSDDDIVTGWINWFHTIYMVFVAKDIDIISYCDKCNSGGSSCV